MPSARATPNIALIKYWGNASDRWRLPAAESLSMTLDQPAVEICVEPADEFRINSINANGDVRVMTEKELNRFRTHRALVDHYLEELGISKALPEYCALTIRSAIPSAIGLASSAAVFACLAKAYAEVILEKIRLNDEQISVIARLGSGSATRGIFGGYSAIRIKNDDRIDGACGEQIAPPEHWLLHDIVIAPSLKEKAYGSTEGHAFAPTSPLFANRIKEIPRRMRECEDAILERDFEKLQHISEEDCLDMHQVMETSTPPLKYLSDETHRIIQEIEELRTREHLEVLFTMDAGPTVHLLCTEAAQPQILKYAKSQEVLGCTIFETKTGPGATSIRNEY